jgi:DNA-binding PadR family transcriptional regulator
LEHITPVAHRVEHATAHHDLEVAQHTGSGMLSGKTSFGRNPRGALCLRAEFVRIPPALDCYARTVESTDSVAGSELPHLPPTSWVVLGMLSFGEEVSGYDIKRWSDWSVGHFYWSPSSSQVYAELKRLENHGFAISRVQHVDGLRGKRIYQISEAGREAISRWANEAPIDPPILKHGLLLRIWMGHVSSPDRLKQILHEHVAHMDKVRRRLAADADGAALEPAWAYPRIAMLWAERYYTAERDLALQLIDEIDDAEAALIKGVHDAAGAFPTPRPGRWREVEERVQGRDHTGG